MEKKKLKFGNVYYKVNIEKKIVVAHLETYYWTPRVGINQIKSIGVARCSSEDTFDELQGKRLARAKAEKAAYIVFREELKKEKSIVEDNLNSLNYSIDCMTDYINHQKKYIKSF